MEPGDLERELSELQRSTRMRQSVDGFARAAQEASGAPVYVHLDLDVLDPSVMPAEYPADGGLPAEKLYDLLDAVADACEVVGIEIVCLEDRSLAGMVADAVAPLVPPA